MEGIIGELWAEPHLPFGRACVFGGDAVVAETALPKEDAAGALNSLNTIGFHSPTACTGILAVAVFFKNVTLPTIIAPAIYFRGHAHHLDEPKFTNYYYSRLFGKNYILSIICRRA